MKRFKQKALLRAAMAIAGITIIVGGITYAALQSQQAVLKGNTIQTAIANLQLSNDGITYTNSLSGYAFNGIVPGGQPMPQNGYPVYLKNVGSTPLSLKLSVPNPVTNPSGVDLSKVHVILTPFSGGAPQNITLQDLTAGASTGGVALTVASKLLPGQSSGYNIQVSMDIDATTGPSANIGDIDFSFGATATN